MSIILIYSNTPHRVEKKLKLATIFYTCSVKNPRNINRNIKNLKQFSRKTTGQFINVLFSTYKGLKCAALQGTIQHVVLMLKCRQDRLTGDWQPADEGLFTRTLTRFRLYSLCLRHCDVRAFKHLFSFYFLYNSMCINVKILNLWNPRDTRLTPCVFSDAFGRVDITLYTLKFKVI